MNTQWKVSLDESRIQRSSRTLQAYLWMKRLMDVVLVSIGIILLMPIFVMIALLIKLDDPKGVVFFYQMRSGKDGKPFRMYKFRSMVANAEELLAGLIDKNEVQGHMFKMKDDPRITRIGKFIRKTSLDELPQLLNVLRGEMSLVGPRPPLLMEVKHYSSYHMQRLRVIPGCTGLWQISGRSNLNFEQMIELDLRYISERSLFLDMKIILKTFRALLGAKGAF
ncbi:sugar transferase [Paenibacillus eucommiae]|uniref:Lipopolysaccharide/colanic/teichoic acid biosynthesis glycosyltransferase n=1 Tax=Paenibacillus eucommiae TaxID=1355755 RepID=A0ABS4J2B9_9BACL|nr:sugar transferase [Paenibacillus eucommiae]MBP1993984.1 lipopolysaccharide/colanic/teichoic acid biosynthesis glycosyltransferase [Paenibacillus eucommiae]